MLLDPDRQVSGPKIRKPTFETFGPAKAACANKAAVQLANQVSPKLMGWTPPGGIDVPKWRCEHTT